MDIELKQQMSQAQQIQEKYERELMEHANTAQTSREHRGAIKVSDVQITELQQAKATAEDSLKNLKDDAKATETTLRSEYKSLQVKNFVRALPDITSGPEVRRILKVRTVRKPTFSFQSRTQDF